MAWQWWLAGFAALLCGAGGPSIPVSLRSAGLQRYLNQCNQQSCFCSPAVPTLSSFRDLPGRRAFAGMALFVWLLHELCLWRAPAQSGSPWQCLGISLVPDGNGLEPGARGQGSQLPAWLNSVEKLPWFLEMAPRCLIPAGLSCGGGSLLSWKWGADGRSESRETWGDVGRNGGCSWAGQIFRWGEAGHPTKSCQLLGFSHPGLFGVAETAFDVLFGVVSLGH